MINYKDQRETIEAIMDNGKNILEIELGNESAFFIVDSFEPPINGASMSAPYLIFRGFDATDFIVNNIYTEGNRNVFLDKIVNLNERRRRDYKFSSNYKWIYYGT